MATAINTANPSNQVKTPALTITKYEVIDAYFATLKEEAVAGSSPKNHTVVKGDTLGKIAKANGVKVDDIKKANGLKSDTIKLGQKLIINKGKKKAVFSKTTEAELGQKIYVVAETKLLKDKTVAVNVQQTKEKSITDIDKAITLKQGSTIKEKVGAFSKKDYSNKDDFKDWVVVELELIASDDKTLKTWKKSIMDATDSKAYLSILIDAHQFNDGIENTMIEYHGKNSGDDSTNTNVWCDNDSSRLQVTNPVPIVFIDPGHGYSSGNVGSSARKYHHKVKGTDGKPKKDDKGVEIIKKSVKLDDLPQYVLDDVDTWVTGHKGDTPGKSERVLVYDASKKLYDYLVSKSYPSDKIVFIRDGIRDENKGKTLRERIAYSNTEKADYFISVHADGSTKYSTSGAHAIYSAAANTSEGKELSADIMKHYSVVHVESASPKKDVRGLGIFRSKHKAKYVTLVEMGFITNPKEAKAMFDNTKKIGDQLGKGLLENIKKNFFVNFK